MTIVCILLGASLFANCFLLYKWLSTDKKYKDFAGGGGVDSGKDDSKKGKAQ